MEEDKLIIVENFTKRKSVLCALDDPTPIAYFNVYEEGDVWLRIKGCESCPLENRKKCCGNCPMLTPDGNCFWHLESGAGSSKPFRCVVKPYPDTCKRFCSLEFRCIQGGKKGKTRKVSKPGNIYD